jgi:pyruvate-formate lyase-activating enzyme
VPARIAKEERMRHVDFKKIKFPRKAAGILLNDRCPLKCTHCSIGYSDTYAGTRATFEEDQLTELVDAFVNDGFDLIAFTGGEPTLVPRLLRIGLKAAQERGVRSVVVTAPVWAKSLAAAEKFLTGLPHLDVVVLSYDRHHLAFLTIEHYTNAVTALHAVGATATFNVCYSRGEERAELHASLQRIYPDLQALPKNLSGVSTQLNMSWEQARNLMRMRLSKGPFVNFERILPVGNGTSLPEVFSEAVTLESIEDFDRIERSCNVGNNVAVDTKFNLHACCWAPIIPGSPLSFERDPAAAFAASLNKMDSDERVCGLKQNGLIGSLTADEKERLLVSMRGKPIINECHLCHSALARPERASVESAEALSTRNRQSAAPARTEGSLSGDSASA